MRLGSPAEARCRSGTRQGLHVRSASISDLMTGLHSWNLTDDGVTASPSPPTPPPEEEVDKERDDGDRNQRDGHCNTRHSADAERHGRFVGGAEQGAGSRGG